MGLGALRNDVKMVNKGWYTFDGQKNVELTSLQSYEIILSKILACNLCTSPTMFA